MTLNHIEVLDLDFPKVDRTDIWFNVYYLVKRTYLTYMWPYLAYLGALNMVNWTAPEKILQNAVQVRTDLWIYKVENFGCHF